MRGDPLGSWPEVERRRGADRRIMAERRILGNRRAGEERRFMDRRRSRPLSGIKVPLPDRRGKSPRRSDAPRRIIMRRASLDRRLRPLFP